MSIEEGLAYSVRDAILNDPNYCNFCDLLIFAGQPCIILVPLETAKNVGLVKGLGFHGEECFTGWKKKLERQGKHFLIQEDKSEPVYGSHEIRQ